MNSHDTSPPMPPPPAEGSRDSRIAEMTDFLMLAQRSCFLDLSSDLNKGRVSYAQLFLLGSLAEDGAMTMSEIAARMGHSTAAATGLVDRLQRLGYVERSHAEDDRRKILVEVTNEGRRLVSTIRQGLSASLAKLMADADASPDAASAKGEPQGRA